jgi:hypothetical protein
LGVDDLRAQGVVHLAKWLAQAEAEWAHRRGPKASTMTVLQRLDYSGGIVQQRPNAAFQALYAMSGTHVCACVVAASHLSRSSSGGLKAQSFLADYTTYFAELPSEEESHYLVAILNGPTVNQQIKASQAKGLWGARHVCKKVLDLPILKFDPESKDHLRLAEIGAACARRVERWIDEEGPGSTRSIGVLRRRVREMLSEELTEIDSIVRPMLGS